MAISNCNELNTGQKNISVIFREIIGVVEVAHFNSPSLMVLTSFISQTPVAQSGGQTK